MQMKQLSIIIVSYNNLQIVKDCLDSIERYNDIGDKLECIVVEQSPSNETQARALGMNEFRLYGYISEYLLNIWVIHQEKEKHIRVKSLLTVFWTNADKTHSFKQLSKLYVKQAFNIVFPYSSPIRE